MKRGVSRREFLRGTLFGSLGTIITTRMGWLFPEAQQVSNVPASTIPLITPAKKYSLAETGGELFGGFVLLPEGAPVPDIVQDYKFGIPTMCGVSETHSESHNVAGALHMNLANADELAVRGKFPIYTFNKPPYRLQPSGASLIAHDTGEVWGGWVTFKLHDPTLNATYTALSILAQFDFPQPMPLWSGKQVEADVPPVRLEKVDFTPGGFGILVRARFGFALHWIQNGVYYTLSADHLPDADPREIASALNLIA
jgi:hypothetical protein